MKRFSKVLVLMIAFVMAFSIMSIPSSAAPASLPWKGISNKIAVNQLVDPSIYFNVTATEARRLRFTSNTPSIIRVENNKIRGLKVGTGTFTTRNTRTGETVKHTIKVVKELTWKKISNKINYGDTVDPVKYYTVNPASRASKLVFKMVNPNNGIAKVVNNKIVGINVGSTKFNTKDPETGASSTNTIIVRPKVTWKKISNKIKVGETVDPSKYYDIEPASRASKLVFTMVDSNNGIAKVVNNKIVGVSAGSTKFLVSDPETGALSKNTIIVEAVKPTGITASDISINNDGKTTAKISAAVEPANAKATLKYEVVSGPITVDSKTGTVKPTGTGRGKATVKISCVEYPSVSTEVTVTVKTLVTKVTKWNTNVNDEVAVEFGGLTWDPEVNGDFEAKMQEFFSPIFSKLDSALGYIVVGSTEYQIKIANGSVVVLKDGTQIDIQDVINGGGRIDRIIVKVPFRYIEYFLQYANQNTTNGILQFNGNVFSAARFMGYGFEFSNTVNKVTILDKEGGRVDSYTYFVADGKLCFDGDVRNTPIIKDRFANPNHGAYVFSELALDWY